MLPLSHNVLAVDKDSTMKEDGMHVKSWNHFADLLLLLHNKKIANKQIKQTEQSGGYSDSPNHYREVSYVDMSNGHLLSVIQWEVRKPEVVHSIEIYVYDDKGRVTRDYLAAYLPFNRNAPVQTLINIHNYNGELHAFKQFDGSTDLIYEYCEGKLNGKDIQIRLFEDDLVATDYDARQLFKSAEYIACFKNMQSELGKYIRPQ